MTSIGARISNRSCVILEITPGSSRNGFQQASGREKDNWSSKSITCETGRT